MGIIIAMLTLAVAIIIIFRQTFFLANIVNALIIRLIMHLIMTCQHIGYLRIFLRLKKPTPYQCRQNAAGYGGGHKQPQLL